MRRTRPLLAAMLLLASIAPASVNAAPAAVDPATLTPPPNPNYEWTCVQKPTAIDCTGVQRSSAADQNPDPSFACDGHPILVTFQQTVTAHRTHTADGRVVRNHLVGTFDEVWRLEGTVSPLLRSRGRWTETLAYAIPGDTTSRTIVDNGSTLAVSAPGDGVIFANTGHAVFNWDGGEVLALAGPQAMIRDFDGAMAAVCAAFGA
jgi:hypothetical protein